MQAFLTELRQRWKLVLLVAILAAAALSGEKLLTKSPIVTSTTLYIEDNVHIQYNGYQPGSAKYENLFDSYGNLYRFVQQSSKDFDFEKFQPGWNGMGPEGQVKWLKKHILANDVTPNVITVALYVSETEWKDPDYVRENGAKLLNAYIDFHEKTMKELGEDVTFQKSETAAFLPQEVRISRKSMLGKYAVIGFVLGGLAACLGLFVIAARKSHA